MIDTTPIGQNDDDCEKQLPHIDPYANDDDDFDGVDTYTPKIIIIQ